jgi:hypothetical protein
MRSRTREPASETIGAPLDAAMPSRVAGPSCSRHRKPQPQVRLCYPAVFMPTLPAIKLISSTGGGKDRSRCAPPTRAMSRNISLTLWSVTDLAGPERESVCLPSADVLGDGDLLPDRTVAAALFGSIVDYTLHRYPYSRLLAHRLGGVYGWSGQPPMAPRERRVRRQGAVMASPCRFLMLCPHGSTSRSTRIVTRKRAGGPCQRRFISQLHGKGNLRACAEERVPLAREPTFQALGAEIG